MSDYTKITNFTSKDTLPTGNAGKIVKGAEIDTEFNAIATSIATKADLASPTFTGAPLAPTATAGTNTTQLATTAFVNTGITNERSTAATLTNKTLTSPAISGGTITGLSAPLPVASGGTSVATIPANAVVLGNGTSAIQTVAPSTSGNLLTSNGTTWVSQAPAAEQTQAQLFTSSGTWTAPANVTKVEVIVIAGGGGYNGYNQSSAGGGGFAHAICTVTPGTSYTVTVGSGGTYQGGNAVAGSGGTSSFGSLVSATGGGGGVPTTPSYYISGSNGSGTVSSGTTIRTGNVNYGEPTYKYIYASPYTTTDNVSTIIGYANFTGVAFTNTTSTYSTSSNGAAGGGGSVYPNNGNGGVVFLKWTSV